MSDSETRVARGAPGADIPTMIQAYAPGEVGAHVGARIRLFRTTLGLSQTALGDAVGISYQQIQKYEHGDVRVGASVLYVLARVLGVPLSAFFEGLDPAGARPGPSADAMATEDLIHRRETLELVRAYYRVTEPEQRRNLLALVDSLGNPGT